MIRNVIFDWSGTLVDDFPYVLDATNEIFKHYGYPPYSREEFKEKFFLPFPDFYKKYLPEATMVELEHHYHTAFRLLQENIPPLEGAVEILEYCRSRGMKIFLLSTIHAQHYDVQAARLGLKEYFTQAYVQALDKRKTILKLISDHDINPSETLFVGDMQHDIETAKHGGVVSCAVLTGYDSLEKLKLSEPDLLFRDLAGVKGYIERHQDDAVHRHDFPIATVGALIHDKDGRVLMIRTHKWSDKWGIPGGKIKWNESSLDALKREIIEETALELRDIKFVMVHDCIASTEFYRPAHFLLLNYTAIADSTEVRLNDEAEEYKWVTPAEAFAMTINQPTRKLLEAVYPKK